jgi:DNA modification methylase
MNKIKELNIIYNEDCVTGLKKLPNESVDLIVADPPYFKVISESWDYEMSTLEEYISWTRQYVSELYRVARKGASFYLFGYFRILVNLVPEIEKFGFELRQQIIVDKGIKAVAGRHTSTYKMFPNTTESILFFVKDSKPFVKQLLREKQKELGIKSKEINDRLGVKSNGGGMWSIYTGDNMCKQLPTEELWKKLCEILKIHDVPYNSFSQTFHILKGYHDVWNDINFYEEKRYHPTQKPVKLIDRLILSSSNDGDVVLDPFIGVGSTALSCISNHRSYIGFEINEKYYQKALERIDQEKTKLF